MIFYKLYSDSTNFLSIKSAEKRLFSISPEAVLTVVSSDMGAVHHSCKVVGAPLLPVPNALGLLSVRLGALDVNTGLVTQHQLGLVCNCENVNKSCAEFLCFILF